MGDSLLAPVKFVAVTLVALAIALRLARDFTTTERRIVVASMLFHAVSAMAGEAIFRFVYQTGDMFAYQLYGGLIARYLALDLANFGDVMGLLFQTGNVPFLVPGAGSSTGSMCALAGLLSFFFSNTVYVMAAAIGGASGIGQLLIHRITRSELPPALWNRAAIALLLLPTVVFWSSTLLKESVIMLPIALVMTGLWFLTRKRRRVLGGVLVVGGLVPIALIKPYVLGGLFLAGPLYIIANQAKQRNKRFALSGRQILAMLVALPAFLLLFGQLFNDFDVETLGQHLAQQQEASLSSGGVSTYSIVSPGSSSLASQLIFAPLAIFTTFFRPLVFEAHNAQSLANAIEATALLGFTSLAVARHGVRKLVRVVLGSPVLIFFFAYAAVLGLGIGLATTNMGALSRYRIPMYAEFAAIVMILSAKPSIAVREQ